MNNEKNSDDIRKYATDDELFNALMNNDEQAKKQLHKDKIRLLYWLAFRIVKNKEEAAYIARYAFSKSLSGGPFKDLEHLIRYMKRAVRYASLDYLKGLNAAKTIPAYKIVPLENEEDELAAKQQIEDDFTKAERLKAVYAEINNLPDLERRMMWLSLEGKKTAEIAEELGCTPREVRDKLRTLPEIIRKALINKNIITVLFLLFFIK
jgi:RNA polymerase sigma factor (sigma-70 family)